MLNKYKKSELIQIINNLESEIAFMKKRERNLEKQVATLTELLSTNKIGLSKDQRYAFIGGFKYARIEDLVLTSEPHTATLQFKLLVDSLEEQ